MNALTNMTQVLLNAELEYSTLQTRRTHEEEEFTYFEVSASTGAKVATVVLWRGPYGLEMTEGWLDLSYEANEALHADDRLGLDGLLDWSAIQQAIYNACLDADDAPPVTAEVGDLHDGVIEVEVLIGGQRVGRVRAARCRDLCHPEGGLAVRVEDAESICRERASLSVEMIERAASDAFRSAWADPLHPTPEWVINEAVDAYADLIGDGITEGDVRELGFEGALEAYHGWDSWMGKQQPWTVIYSAAEVAAMAEWWEASR